MTSKFFINIFFVAGFLSVTIAGNLSAQTLIKGKVFGKTETDRETLAAANVYWLDNQKGTTTDSEGNFSLSRTSKNKKLVVSYIGYLSDTLEAGDKTYIEITLKPDAALSEVVIKADKTLSLEPMQTEMLTVKDLQKAACCNLSESFETNASVEVGQADAVSGSKQLKMLGLDGIYAQIMTEKMGFARGLLTRNGMNFIPGTWLKSVDLNKGAGSVTDGYESVTGQINAELVKPENSEKWLLNLYANEGGRTEINSNHSFRVSEKWSSALLVHGSSQLIENDENKDGFRDIPKYYQVNLLNRWNYRGEFREAQLGAHVVYDNRLGGMVNTPWQNQNAVGLPYGAGSTAKSLRVWSKTGFISKSKEGRSLGVILSGNLNELRSYWGLNDYDGMQKNANATVIFQTPVGVGDDLKTGVSFVYDDYRQQFHQNIPVSAQFSQDRSERVAGVFAEYTFNGINNLTAVGGLRADKHNLYGNFLFPRLHLKYELSENSILRFSTGRGMRVANVFVDFAHFLASSRIVTLENNLRPELAWNTGGSFSHKFYLAERAGIFTTDFYRTVFQNQIIADLETKDYHLSFYNLRGASYANSFQAELKYEVLKGFNVNLAYKYYDIKATYDGILYEVPFVSKHRGFVNLAYETPNEKWQFDFTTHYFGSRRMPYTSYWEHLHGKRTPAYVIIHAQITRNWKNLAVYIGAENLNNFMQHAPIVAADAPYGQKFDGGMIWAPIMGRMSYAGMRFYINRN
jgi:outer membrane cobalamin receptor